MIRRGLLTFGTAVGLLFSGSAMAADYNSYSSGNFDWDGFYAGLGVTGSSLTNGVTDTAGYLDFVVGGNVTSGNFLFGAEGWVGLYGISGGNSGVGGGVEGRIGFLLSEEVLLYTGIGGYFQGNGGNYGTLGLGAEFAVTDYVSVDAEYKYWAWSDNGFTGHSLGLSALYHF